MSKIKIILVTFFGLIIIAVVFFTVYKLQKLNRESQINIPAISHNQTKSGGQTDQANSQESTLESGQIAENLSTNYLLKVPFQSQAPFIDWSEPYENACEEASIIMVEHYLNNQDLSKEQMKNEIDRAVDWQIKNWKKHTDLNADQTLKLAEDYFNLTGQVIRSYSLNDIEKYISSGYPVLVPTDGQLLGNPNFRGVGPEYHMLVLIGYDDSQEIFITNDPGTRKGEKYIYKYQTVLDAVSGPKKNMEKAVIVLGK